MTLTTDTLTDAVRRLPKASAAIPILQSVRFTPGQVAATDLESTVWVDVPHDVDVLAARDPLTQALQAAPKGAPTTLTVQGGELVVKAARFEAAIPTFDVASYPTLPTPAPESADGFVLDPADLEAAVQTSVFASRDKTRPVLTGVHVTWGPGGVEVGATDSYRLGAVTIGKGAVTGKGEFLAPPEAFTGVDRDEPVSFRVAAGNTAVTVRGTGVVSVHRLIDGQYPDFEKLIPPAESCTFLRFAAGANLDDLTRFIDANAKQSGKGVTIIRFTFTAGSPEGEARVIIDQGVTCAIRFNLDEAWGGDTLTIGVDAAKLADLHKWFTGGRVGLIAPFRPVVFDIDGRRGLLMPVRIDAAPPVAAAAAAAA